MFHKRRIYLRPRSLERRHAVRWHRNLAALYPECERDVCGGGEERSAFCVYFHGGVGIGG